MNYKEMIPNFNFRIKILNILNFIPDKLMLQIQYRIKTGRKLNLKDPERYSEKIQWYKLYYRDPLMVVCTDKAKVKDYVKSKGFEDIIIPTYGIYKNVNDINIEDFPNKAVIKTTDGGGGLNVSVINDNKSFIKAKSKFTNIHNEKKKNKSPGREWPYDKMNSEIIVEKYVESNSNDGLIDYKIYCFNGEPEFLHVTTQRENSDGKKVSFFNLNFERLQISRTDLATSTEKLKKPQNFEYMVKIAKSLSEDFPHVRVDLYNIDGKVLFGELTFFGGSGYTIFDPDEFDFIIGDKFILPEK